MNKLNLDIEKYSCEELCDIFKISSIDDSQELSTHINIYKNNILTDNKLSLSEKDNMTKFLNKVVKKFTDSKYLTSQFEDKNHINDTFSSLHNRLIKDTPENHPIIMNQNSEAGLHAKTYQGRNVDTKEYPPGYINPINIKTTKKIVNIDSRFRTSYYATQSSDYHISLPESFKKVVSMQISSIEIPLTIHAISSSLKNNYFTIDSSLVDVSSGNYSSFADINNPAIDFCNNILDNMQTFINKSGFSDISYSVDPITGKSKFTNTGTTSHKIFFYDVCNNDLDTPLPLKLGWMLGFRTGAYELHGSSTINSEGLLSIIGPKYIYICINDFTNAGNNSFISAYSDSILSPHIIARINYQALVQNNGIFNIGAGGDFSDSIIRTREYFGPVDIQKLHFQIIDEYGRVVNFNNMDWSCALTFKTLYD